jgi:hypothetical protein
MVDSQITTDFNLNDYCRFNILTLPNRLQLTYFYRYLAVRFRTKIMVDPNLLFTILL